MRDLQRYVDDRASDQMVIDAVLRGCRFSEAFGDAEFKDVTDKRLARAKAHRRLMDDCIEAAERDLGL
jgi:hypothetical protein